MRIFLAGATHAVGKRVAYLLAKDQHQVTAAVADRNEAREASSVGAKPLVLHLLNVSDVQAALYGQEAVINLATEAGNAHLWGKNDVLRRALSLSMAHGALKNRVPRFIQESSVYVYADQSGQPIGEDGRWRSGPLTASAIAVERNALELEKAGVTSVVLRFASVYSSDSPDTQKIIRYAKFGYYMQAGPPDGFVPMVHADDAAKAVVEALKAPAGVWNVVEDNSLTRRESALALATALGRSSLGIPSAWVRNWAGPDVDITGESMKVSNFKFKGATAWKPNFISPREGWKSVVIQADR